LLHRLRRRLKQDAEVGHFTPQPIHEGGRVVYLADEWDRYFKERMDRARQSGKKTILPDNLVAFNNPEARARASIAKRPAERKGEVRS
jgi:hypothetical protein